MRYLSNEWIAAAAQALADADSPAPDGHVVIDQHVDGVVSYRITIANNAGVLSPLGRDTNPGDTNPGDTNPGAANAPDASFHQSLGTARDVATGATDAHQAFLLGQIRFEGEIDALIENREAIEWVHGALAPLMAATTFADPTS